MQMEINEGTWCPTCHKKVLDALYNREKASGKDDPESEIRICRVGEVKIYSRKRCCECEKVGIALGKIVDKHGIEYYFCENCLDIKVFYAAQAEVGCADNPSPSWENHEAKFDTF